jgi:hypothetical protein
MNQYRKKPVVIDAIQITDQNLVELLGITEEHPHVKTLCVIVEGNAITNRVHSVEIETPEGTMTGQPGDWLIRGVQGEFYPCKPSIFAATYEPA